MQPRDPVLVDVEILPDQLTQQIMSSLDRLVVEQTCLRDGPQRPFGVLGDPGEHPLALGLLAPAAIGLLGRSGVVELSRAGAEGDRVACFWIFSISVSSRRSRRVLAPSVVRVPFVRTRWAGGRRALRAVACG